MTYARWVCITSFDRPVVPEVGIITATSLGSPAPGPRPSGATSNSSVTSARVTLDARLRLRVGERVGPGEQPGLVGDLLDRPPEKDGNGAPQTTRWGRRGCGSRPRARGRRARSPRSFGHSR